ncbi:DNA polymerase III subunit gamma/tau [uncultured Novosphingobium sp.]|uniref:DNA polymerase III subunit gamma/tau n=1 Tax=uncultured Novosphingobium sp. TaxID=292277 RepID=UPI00258F5334|nr:DNA polymerase III subunit gamma/tau [uncultured Novosphingobium sp.]
MSDDSRDMFGDTPPWQPDEEDNAPSAAELEKAGQSSMFGDPAPSPAPSGITEPAATAAPAPPVSSAAKSAAAQPYRVLARKYRPQTFAQLIGQEAMVRTLANAIKRDRLAHAFLMTGVRGVGKTSTARLIAKALNCIGPDGKGGPTIDPCGQCEPCTAIAEGRHIDVIEMDAASHTGVDDVREIIEAVRYAAVSARYKIYIIDEVHMLSRNAFNALLKTLEEPPAHVKFLFATTEVDKLPVTVLSRCQRFDLRRIPSPMLAEHFAHVCQSEGVQAEDEALAMIAAAAEGSVRDGLSILDQAIAHADLDGAETGQGLVQAARVRDMLGLADKSAQRGLLDSVLNADGAGLLDRVAQQFALGVEPIALMRGVMTLVHRITVAQVSAGAADAPSAEEREAIEGWAKRLSAGQLHRLWQLLLKGYEEVKSAPDPLVAAQMALLRVMHAADMPDPGMLARKLEEIAARPAPTVSIEGSGTPAPVAQRPAMVWADLVEQVEQVTGLGMASTLRMQVRVVELAPGVLRYTQPPGFGEDIAALLRNALNKTTGDAWHVEKVPGEGAPTLVEVDEAQKRAAADAKRTAPLVAATLAAFPDAELIEDDRQSASGGGNRNWRR